MMVALNVLKCHWTVYLKWFKLQKKSYVTCMLPHLKSICHYDPSLNLALFSDKFHQASWSVWTERETLPEIKFCRSVLVERKRQRCYISPILHYSLPLQPLRNKPLLRSLGVLDCAQAAGGASAVGADRLCLSLCCFHWLQFARYRSGFARIQREFCNQNHCLNATVLTQEF